MQIYTLKYPVDYAVIDVETTNIKSGEIPQTLFWGFADSNGYKRFATTRALLKFLKTQAPRVLLHHTNFDVIQLLVDGCRDITVDASRDGTLIRCKLWQHTLQNTFTVFPVALASIFKAFRYRKSSLRNLDRRNYEDCVNGLDCFLKLDKLFFDLIGVNPLEIGTVAGTTFRAAEHRAGKMPVDLKNLAAYRGGRVELFDLNGARVWKYDIHSSYPRSFLECPERDILLHLRVNTRDWFCPFFDASRQDMLTFPNGTFKTWIFQSNLERYILKNCQKTRLHVLSKRAINLTWLNDLKPLVKTLYNIRQASADDGIKLCCKFLLNAFYGRIGLKGETEICRILDFPLDGEDVTRYKVGAKTWICFCPIDRVPRANYPFAAFITDNARARLYEAFTRNTAIYGDTDSVWTLRGPDVFGGEIGPGCGQWACEGRGPFKGYGPKDYDWNGVEILKGGRVHVIWTLKQFASGQAPRRIERHRVKPLDKRRVLANGTTAPLMVNN